MTTPSSSPVCPGCGAPAGSGPACEFCGTALPGASRRAGSPPPADPLERITTEDWLREEPDAQPPAPPQRPFSPPETSRPYSSTSGSQQPYGPPPAPSGLEPISLAMGEGLRRGQEGIARFIKPALIGCAVLLFLVIGCGVAALVIFSANANSNF